MKQASLSKLIDPCNLCPRKCGAKRMQGETGFCGVSATPRVASFGPHFGEETQLVGEGGSGAIFLSGCNLRCVFCQNPDISHGLSGYYADVHKISKIMMHLQESGCCNINFVTPTHFADSLAQAVKRAREDGLTLPVVWNCGGYESVEVLDQLAGVVDIFMPDIKTLDSAFASRYLNAPDYPEIVCAALETMYKLAGEIILEDGIARSGVLIRHLVMPGMVADSRNIIETIRQFAPKSLVNITGQYRPCNFADNYPELSRRTAAEETEAARSYASQLGLHLA